MVTTENRATDTYTIQVRGVTKRFGTRAAVDNLTFNVRKGEIVGFLGPNGAGKTTTMRLLTSYYTPDSGTIIISGVDTQEQDIVTRQSIGYLPENNPLYGDMLVAEYLAFVADLRGLPSAQRRENIAQTVEETGLQEVYFRPISQLSKGFRQRVGLAQAILHRPEILIMDEPTEGLDPNQRVTIRELIKSLGKDRTVLLSTHVLQEVESTCDRLLIINRGKLVADGTIPELLARAREVRSIHVEAEGNQIETALRELPSVKAVHRHESIDSRKRYTITVTGEEDLRPQIYRLARKRDWVLWELHEVTPRLEDLFHSLTMATDEDSDDQ